MMMVLMMVVVVVEMISHVDWQLLCSVLIKLTDDKTPLLLFSSDKYLEGYPSSAGFAHCTCAQSMKLVAVLFIFVIKCSEMFLCIAVEVVFDVFENKAYFEKAGFNINETF